MRAHVPPYVPTPALTRGSPALPGSWCKCRSCDSCKQLTTPRSLLTPPPLLLGRSAPLVKSGGGAGGGRGGGGGDGRGGDGDGGSGGSGGTGRGTGSSGGSGSGGGGSSGSSSGQRDAKSNLLWKAFLSALHMLAPSFTPSGRTRLPASAEGCCPAPPNGTWQFIDVSPDMPELSASYKMAVYRQHNDIVSNFLLRGDRWEPALSQLVAEHLTAAMRQGRREDPHARPHFLDVGANVGWFTCLAAALGADVTAIEPNKINTWLIQQSLAANTQLKERVTLHNVAAAATSGDTCHMISSGNNVGDTMLVCGDLQAALERWNAWGRKQRQRVESFAPRGTLITARLDDLVKTPVDVLKIDIEGFEAFAAQGWSKIFERRRPRLVLSEYQPRTMLQNGFDPVAYLAFFVRRGYTLFACRPTVYIDTEAKLQRWLNATNWDRSYDMRMILAADLPDAAPRLRCQTQ